MRAHEAAALAAIDAEYERPIAYTGAGLTGQTIPAIRSDEDGPGFPGAGATLREISFEVRQADLPNDPEPGDTFVDEGGHPWSVTEPRRRDEIGKWLLIAAEAEAEDD